MNEIIEDLPLPDPLKLPPAHLPQILDRSAFDSTNTT